MIGLAAALVSSVGNRRFRYLHDVYMVFFAEVHL